VSREEYERVVTALGKEAVNPPTEYEQLASAKKELLAHWIRKAMKPSSKYDEQHSSYGIKHHFEQETGIYVSNGEFKGAMLIAGYLPKRVTHQNWTFQIAKTYDQRRIPHDLGSQRRARELPYYRTRHDGGMDAEILQFIEKVHQQEGTRRIRFLPSSELFSKTEHFEEVERNEARRAEERHPD
jgi:hypothetical protein